MFVSSIWRQKPVWPTDLCHLGFPQTIHLFYGKHSTLSVSSAFHFPLHLYCCFYVPPTPPPLNPKNIRTHTFVFNSICSAHSLHIDQRFLCLPSTQLNHFSIDDNHQLLVLTSVELRLLRSLPRLLAANGFGWAADLIDPGSRLLWAAAAFRVRWRALPESLINMQISARECVPASLQSHQAAFYTFC